MQKAGVDCRHIIRSGDVQTATAVLPIYGHGDRDCFACLGANLEFSLTDAQRVIYSIEKESGNQPLAAIHFGYPHFLPKLQGDDLGTFLCRARSALGQPLISMVTTYYNTVVIRMFVNTRTTSPPKVVCNISSHSKFFNMSIVSIFPYSHFAFPSLTHAATYFLLD